MFILLMMRGNQAEKRGVAWVPASLEGLQRSVMAVLWVGGCTLPGLPRSDVSVPFPLASAFLTRKNNVGYNVSQQLSQLFIIQICFKNGKNHLDAQGEVSEQQIPEGRGQRAEEEVISQ